MKSETIQIRLDSEKKSRISAAAEAQGLSLTQYILQELEDPAISQIQRALDMKGAKYSTAWLSYLIATAEQLSEGVDASELDSARRWLLKVAGVLKMIQSSQNSEEFVSLLEHILEHPSDDMLAMMRIEFQHFLGVEK